MFKSGDVVWVKCGQLHWPAEVLDFEGLPVQVKQDFDSGQRPELVVKFFDEDG